MITREMWRNLSTMADYYEECGYRDLPQPWVASSQAINVTLPAGGTSTTLNDGQILVGSAEQCFIEALLSGDLQPGRWQAITPCFRNEPVFDELHKPYFMKLELIHYMPRDAQASLVAMLDHAYGGFSRLLKHDRPSNIMEQTEINCCDLTLRGVEIGSYGIREHAGHQWVYGTGIAEPRFTTVNRPAM